VRTRAVYKNKGDLQDHRERGSYKMLWKRRGALRELVIIKKEGRTNMSSPKKVGGARGRRNRLWPHHFPKKRVGGGNGISNNLISWVEKRQSLRGGI